MVKRILPFVIAGLMVTSAHAQHSPTLRKIQETGVITIGFRDKSIPFSFLDRQQRPIGYSIDLCQRVVDAIRVKMNLPGLEVLMRPVTSANRISFVVNDIIDLECGSTTNTAERKKDVAFSVTTFVASGSLVSKRARDIHSLQELRGHTVVSTAGTTYVKGLAESNRKLGLGMSIIAGKGHADSFQLVETDRAAAFAMDDVLLHGLVANTRNPADYVIYNSELSVEPYGIVLRKDDPEFKRIVDEALAALFRSGDINTIYRKWFLSPIPPNRAELHLPMSNALRKAISFPTDSSDPARYR
ncbi:MAG: amino acid ABC transporter substrate-binding protein [Pseudomonadota bacterium]